MYESLAKELRDDDVADFTALLLANKGQLIDILKHDCQEKARQVVAFLKAQQSALKLSKVAGNLLFEISQTVEAFAAAASSAECERICEMMLELIKLTVAYLKSQKAG